MHIGYSWESKKERDHQKYLDAGGITLKRILERTGSCELNLCSSGYEAADGFCEHGNEPYDLTKCL
jgi:hypothetical protein